MTIIVKTRNRAMEKLQAELDDRKRREEGKQFVDNPVEQEGSPKTKKPYIAPIVKPYTVPIDQDAEVAAIFDDLKDFRIDIGAGVKTPVEQLQDQAVVPTPNVVTPEGFTLEPTQAEAPADVPLIIGPSTTQELARDILNKRASPRIMGKGTVEESKGPKIVFDPVTGEKIDYSNVEKSQLEFERQSVEEKSIGVDLGSEASIEKFRKLWDYNLNDAALNEFVRSAITMTTILSDTSISDDYRGDFTAVDLNDFVGDYYSKELDVIYHLRVTEDKLTVSLGNIEPLTLSVSAKDQLSYQGSVWDFERTDGKITGFRMAAGRVQNLAFIKTAVE